MERVRLRLKSVTQMRVMKTDEDVCKEVDKENQPPMVCPDDNYVYPTTYPTVTLKTRRAWRKRGEEAMTSEWRGITTSVLSNVMTAGPSHLCHPLLDLNMCRRFNAGTKPTKPSLKLRGLTLLVPTTSTWEVWICWTHLQPNISSPSNPVAGTCTSSGTPSSSLWSMPGCSTSGTVKRSRCLAKRQWTGDSFRHS